MLKKLLILFVIPLLLCGCVNKNSSKEEITFSSWGSITEVKILDKIISDFEQENPDIKINFLHIPQNYFQKLHLLFASRTAPDVIFLNNLYLPIYANHLDNLSSLVDNSEYYDKSLEALSIDGKLLAIPRDISTLVFYRNKNLIPKAPTNLYEFMQYVSKSKYYGVSYERNMYYLFPYILTFGEDIYNPQKSLEFYKNLEGEYAPRPSDVGSLTQAQMFIDGKIGLYLSGRWMYPKISSEVNFDWDVITFPGIVPLDASGWAISKYSKHKESAIKFIKYLSSNETSEYFMSTGLLVPAKIDVAKNINDKAFIDSIKNSAVLPIQDNFVKQIDIMNNKIFE